MSRPAHKKSREKKRLKLEPLEPRTLFSADILSAAIIAVPLQDTHDTELLSNEWADNLRSEDGSSKVKRSALTTDGTAKLNEGSTANTTTIIENRAELSDFTEEMAVYAPVSGSTNVIQVSTTDDVIDGDTSSIDALILDNGADGQISLREAIIAANNQLGTDTIQLSQGLYTLTITGKFEDQGETGDLDITSDIILEGADSSTTLISASTLDDRVLDVHADASLVASNITLRDGGTTSTKGGAVHNEGDLTLTNTALIGNVSINSPGGAIWNSGTSELLNVEFSQNTSNVGGAVHNQPTGSLTIDGTTFSLNVATNGPGGAIHNEGQLLLINSALINNTGHNGGAIGTDGGTTEIINTTISGNESTFRGGGITHEGGTLTIESSTVSKNTSGGVGGGLNVKTGTAKTSNSIYADNVNNNGGSDIYGAITSNGVNLIEAPDSSSFSGESNVDIVGLDPKLNSLGYYGGLTPTHAIDTDSPAHDTADATNSPTHDQTGKIRDITPDIGAYEISGGIPPNQAPQLTLSSNSEIYIENDVLIVDTNASIADADSIDFDTGVLTITSTDFAETSDLLAINSVGNGIGEIFVSGSTVQYEGVAIGTWAGGTGSTPLEITLNNTASADSVTALAQNITFSIDSQAPSTQTRTLEFTVSDGDGATSIPASIDITVQGINQAPEIDIAFDRVFINEFHYDDYFQDENERIELAGGSGTDLNGWRLVLYSMGDTPYRTIHLSGILPDQSNGIGTTFIAVPNLQNGPNDGIVLINPAGDIVEFISYEGVITATVGPAAGMTSIDVGVAESNYGSANNSIQRTDLGEGSNWTGPSNSSFGDLNNGQSTANINNFYQIDEDTSLTFSHADGNSIVISDIDTTNNLNIALSANSGVLALASNPANTNSSVTLTGTLADINSELDGLIYQPDSNFNGEDTLTITVDDQDTTAGSNQTATDSITIDVLPINDAPVLGPLTTLIYLEIEQQEDDTNPTTFKIADHWVTQSFGLTTDADTNALEGITVVSTDNSNGYWQFSIDNGNTWENFGTTSISAATVLDITAEVRFIPDADYAGISSIEFGGWDQTDGIASGTQNVDVSTNGGSTAYSNTFSNLHTTVKEVDDKPALSLDLDNSSGSIQNNNYLTSFSAGDTPVTITDADAILSDIDSATLDQLTITLNNPLDGPMEQLSIDTSGYANFSQLYNTTNNTITVSATNGAVTDFEAILKTAKYQNSSTTPTITDRTITVTATDHTGLTTSAQSTIQILPDSNAPTISNNIPLTVAEGSQGNITNVELSATDDIQPVASVSYNITAPPSFGFIANTSAPNTPITQFSQSMLDANQIVYVHDGSESTGDQFEFSVSDSVGNSNDNNTFSIPISAVNDPPSISAPSAATVYEDNTLALGAANAITVSDYDASEVEVTLSVTSGILSIADNVGTLNLTSTDSSSITVDGNILAINTALGGLSYTPAYNFNGSDALNIEINDLGQFGSGGVLSNTSSVDITIDAVNDAPSGTSNAISLLEDQHYIFSDTDFGYSDTDSDTFTDILITSAPANGTLTLQGSPVNTGTTIPVSSINQGLLSFQPDSQLNGIGLTGFNFEVGDNGGTNNGGESRALTPSTIAFDILAVNDAPIGQDNTVNTFEDTAYVFIDADFGFTDPIENHDFKQLEIISLPTSGNLLINNTVATIGSTVTAADLSAGNFAFLPDQDATGSNYASFRFAVSDNGGTANNGVDKDQTYNTMIVNVDHVNDAPSGTDSTISLLEDSSTTLSAADFGFSDLRDNHSLESVVISTAPTNGQLLQNGNLIASGSVITKNALATGAITFVPDNNANGLAYSTLSFQVRDNGGTLNGGENTDTQANSLTFSVEQISDEPAGTDKLLNISKNNNYTFSIVDFGFTDPLDAPNPDQFLSLEIRQLPGNGTLLYNNLPITAGENITATDIALGTLVYSPPAFVSGDAIDTIAFSVIDTGDTTNNGQIKDSTANIITINIPDASHAPSGTDNTLSILEDTSYTLSSTDFGFNDTNDNDNLAAATITATPTSGSLTLAGVVVSDNQTISITDIDNGRLQYTPSSNDFGTGYSTLSFLVHDTGTTINGGQNVAQNENTLTFNVTPVSDEPIGLDKLISINEDNSHIFSLSDFGFADPLDSVSPDQFLAVEIAQPPITGTLYNNNQPITSGQTVTSTDIAAGLLVYAPSPNTFGQAFDNLSFLVTDSGSTANNGQTQDQSANTIIFDINSVNDAPTGADITIQISEDSSYAFNTADFGFSDSVDLDALLDVQITSINGSGTLQHNGVATQSPLTISHADINAGLLSYTPTADESGTGYASLLFKVRDSGGTSNGGVDTDPTANTLTINVASVNDAPAGTDRSIETREDETVILNLVDFGFSDRDNNQFEAVIINTVPTTGTLQLSGQAVTAGTVVNTANILLNELVYIPQDNFNGSTDFTFSVIDDGGTTDNGQNTDQAANTLTIDIVAVNDAPTGSDTTITITQDNNYIFSSSDFSFADSIDQHSLLGVQITSVTGLGTLSVNGSPTNTPVSLSKADIDAGVLSFAPTDYTAGESYASLAFHVRDTGGIANGGQDTDTTANTLTIDVERVNAEPAGTDSSTETREDELVILNLIDFGFSDPDSNQFEAVIINTLPANGTLQLAGQSISAGTVVSAANILLKELVYVPNDNFNGSADFQFSVIDDGGTLGNGQNTDQTANTLTIDILAVNDAPTGGDKTIQINEDTDYIFSSNDFGFADNIDQHGLLEVHITSANGPGTLLYNGAPANTPVTVSSADIDAGLLTYKPIANTSGENHASLDFHVRDTGGTANGGQDTTPNANTLTIDVEGVNDAPSGTDNTIQLNEDSTYVFNAADFGFSDNIDQHTLLDVQVTSINGSGTLQHNGVATQSPVTISSADINAGLLSYTPAADESGTAYASLLFKVRDSGGTSNGGVDTDPTANTLTINVVSVNDAPTGTDRSTETREDEAVILKLIDFGFSDPDNNQFEAVIINTLPATGTLHLAGQPVTAGTVVNAANISLNELVYVPQENFNGSTDFTFSAIDDGGTTDNGLNTDQVPNTLTVDIVSVNDAPSGIDKTIQTNEDNNYIFSSNDFGFSDSIDQHSLQEIHITSINGSGSVSYIGSLISTPMTLSSTEIEAGFLSFTPTPNTSGSNYTSLAFNVRDTGGIANGGLDTDPSENILTIDVQGVNDAPSGTDNTIETREDETKTLRLIDFGFTDPDNNQFEAVIINTLPTTGILQLAGDTISVGSVVDATDIALNDLIYVPLENLYGATDFQFSVIDDGGTAANGLNTDQSVNTLSIDIQPINDAPLSANQTISINEDTPYQFQLADFPFSDLLDSDSLSQIVIASLPANGALTNNGAALNAGDTISASNITSGDLVFIPESDNISTQQFEFKVRDNGGLVNGGNDTSTSIYTMTLTMEESNDTPTLLNEELTTDEGSQAVISTNALSATDPDDTAQDLSFGILQLPAHGKLFIDGVVLDTGDQFTVADLSQNKVHYVHNGSETSIDHFDFALTDGDDATQAINGRFTININEVIDEAPKPKNNNLTVEQGNSFDTNSGDTLASGDNTLLTHPNLAIEAFEIEVITQPVNGEVSLDPDGGFIYLHNGSNNLDDYFEYRITNEDGVSASARINITVEPAIAEAVNQPVNPNFEDTFPTVTVTDSNNDNDTSELEVVSNESTEESEAAPQETIPENLQFNGEPEYALSSTSTAVDVDYQINETDIGISSTNTNYSRIIFIDREEYETLDVRKHNPLDEINTLGESVNLTVKSVELLVEFPSTAADIINSSNFQQGLTRVNNDLESMANSTRNKFQMGEDLVFGVSLSTTAGVLAWMLRGGALLGSMMAATPLWATIDPLRVATPSKASSDEDNADEVENIFK